MNRTVEEIGTTDPLLTVMPYNNVYHYHPYIYDYEDDVVAQPHKDKLYPGAVRFNNGDWEVWTDTGWVVMEPADKVKYDITTSPRLFDVVLWAEQKMVEEEKLDKLCDEYPTLKDAKDQYETILAIVSADSNVS